MTPTADLWKLFRFERWSQTPEGMVNGQLLVRRAKGWDVGGVLQVTKMEWEALAALLDAAGIVVQGGDTLQAQADAGRKLFNGGGE